MDEDVQYRTTKAAQGEVDGCIYLGQMVFYRQCYYNLDFIPPWLYQDVTEIPLWYFDYIWIPLLFQCE